MTWWCHEAGCAVGEFVVWWDDLTAKVFGPSLEEFVYAAAVVVEDGVGAGHVATGHLERFEEMIEGPHCGESSESSHSFELSFSFCQTFRRVCVDASL